MTITIVRTKRIPGVTVDGEPDYSNPLPAGVIGTYRDTQAKTAAKKLWGIDLSAHLVFKNGFVIHIYRNTDLEHIIERLSINI